MQKTAGTSWINLAMRRWQRRSFLHFCREATSNPTLLLRLSAITWSACKSMGGSVQAAPAGTFCGPISDNGAGLLSNTQLSPMDIMPPALISVLQARPFNTTFTRQMNTIQSLYGTQLTIPKLTAEDIRAILQPLLEYYPYRDRRIITDRVEACILARQKKR